MMRVALVIAMSLAVAGCAAPAPSPEGLISAAQAGVQAIGSVGGASDVKVVATRLSTYGAETGGGAVWPPATPVWVVVLSGSFSSPSCGPSTATPHPCPSAVASAQVLVDANSGAPLQADYPAPSAS